MIDKLPSGIISAQPRELASSGIIGPPKILPSAHCLAQGPLHVCQDSIPGQAASGLCSRARTPDNSMAPPKTARCVSAPPHPSSPIRWRTTVASSQSQLVGQVAVPSFFPPPPDFRRSFESDQPFLARQKMCNPAASLALAQSPSLDLAYDSYGLNRAGALPFESGDVPVKTNCSVLSQRRPEDSDGATPEGARRATSSGPQGVGVPM